MRRKARIAVIMAADGSKIIFKSVKNVFEGGTQWKMTHQFIILILI
jgi:hypothetical protein